MSSFARSALLATAFAAGLFLSTSYSMLAQDAEHDWQKEYVISGVPALTIETGDSSLSVRSCGDCKVMRVRVHSSNKLSDFQLKEHQEGDHIYFTLKEKRHGSAHLGIHMNWKASEATQVSVEVPASLALDARTMDGGFSASSISGDLQLRTEDGATTIDDFRGNLHANASDGDITIHNAAGTLDARASDGHVKVDGQFTAVQIHTSDGALDFALASGSKLTTASHIESSDGRVTIRVPRDLAADLDISTSDGDVECALPLTTDHYDSRESSGHHLHGRLNAGGTPLSIHTSDGNVSIATL